MRPSSARAPRQGLTRTPAFRAIARALVVFLLVQSIPTDGLRVGRAARAHAGDVVLWVDGQGGCGGEVPCHRTIQAAIDAVQAGQTVRILPGEYVEQLVIKRKNVVSRGEIDRIVIEADPRAPVGSVVLRGAKNRCEGGHAVDFDRSRDVTLRGLGISGAGARGVTLRGGARQNAGIRLERNRIFRGATRECSGGIDVGRGNPDTAIVNNLIYANGRHGVRFRDGRGGSYVVVGNTIVGNGWSGITVTRSARATIVNNLIAFNGTASGRSSGRHGVWRQRSATPSPESVALIGNLVCGNRLGEIEGPLLDAGDAGNQTPTGGEGPGVVASPGCGAIEALFAALAGPDGARDTADDDFTLAPGSPARDRGRDPRDVVAVPESVLLADFLGAAARPRDGDGDGSAAFDAGALEAGAGGGATPTPTTTSSATPATPTPTPVTPPTASPSPTPVVATPSPAPSATPTPTRTPTPTTNGAPAAIDDAYEVRSDETLAIAAPGVLGNDDDPDGDPLTAELVDPPAIGTLSSFQPDGGFAYQPPAQFVQPSLNPVARLRVAHGIDGYGQVADFDRDGHPDVVYPEFGALRALDGETGAQLFDFDASDTTNVNVSGCSLFSSSTVAVGDLTGNGDVSMVRAMNCDQTNVVGSADRFVAINGSQITAGKVRATWVTERMTKPHPDALANASAPAPPVPPIRPDLAATAYTEPSLARLDAAGGVKVLARRLLGPSMGQYLARNASGVVETRAAGCRAVTGLAADEGRQCRVTWIIDGTSGGVEQVLTAPNPSGEQDVFSWRPWRQNAPIVADLDGDGEVEIVSGSDVFRRVAGEWQLAWQTRFEPASVAVADLDGDGTAEVVQHQFGSSAGRVAADGGILIYAHDGTLLRRIPFRDPGETSFGLVSIGDADGDGAPEILYTADGVLYVYRADGRLLWLFVIPDRPEPTTNGLVPAPVALFGRSGETAPQVHDLDLDGRPEVILNAASRLYIFDGQSGAEVWSIDTEGGGFGRKTLALADFDADGHVDILAMTSNRWNCSTGGGPVPCRGNTLFVSGQDGNWAPGPKVFNQIQYRPDAVDDAARILFAPGIRRDFRRAQQQGAIVDRRLREGATFTYRASDGGATSSPATVYVKINPENSPPTITSLPPTGLLSLTPYTRPVYQITATDPDPGDVVRYEVVSTTHPFGVGPGAGVNLNPTTGAVDFYVGPCGSFGGPCVFNGDVLVVVAAVDALGARDEQTFLLTISPFQATVPDVVGMLLQPAIDALLAASLRARVLLEIFDPAPAGTVLQQSPAGGAPNVAAGTSVELTLSKGPEPTPTPTPTPSPTPDPNATPTPVPTPGPPLASLVVEPANPIVLVGETQAFTATGVFADGTAADLTSQVTWQSSAQAIATVAASGVAHGIAAGASTIAATIDGATGSTSLTVVARAPGDFTEPIAAITAPQGGAEVTQPVDVIGTATDASFLAYELAIAPAGSDDFSVVAAAGSPVTDGVLGRLDPTLLVNDQYTLRLTVRDRGGNASVAEVVVQVARNMKIGELTLRYVDVEVPLDGLPLGITRSYDSRDKASGAFGVGWRLGLDSIRIRTNRVLGTGWVRTVTVPTVSLAPTDFHTVSVTLPDGRVERFDMTVSPTANIGSLDFTGVTGFTPRPGATGTLTALANPSLLIVGAGAEDALVDDETLNPYDPQLFRYTTADGTQIDVHRTGGVRRIVEPNGHAVTIDAAGMVHSSGEGLSFVRDAAGRITRIEDPSGAVHHYAYDINGDLRAHTDPTGAVTEFFYDRRHNLLRIVDPLGRPVARNEYDEAGRLVASTDAKGNRTQFEHDLAGRRERVVDRLGRATTLTYDERGNVLTAADPLGHTTTFTWDAQDNRLSSTDPLGRTTLYGWDAGRRLVSTTDPLGATTSYTYDAQGRMLTRTDALGRTSAQSNDGAGNPLTLTDPLGHTTTLAYDTSGRVTSVTDPLGRVVASEHDARGRRTALVELDGARTVLASDAIGRIVAQTGPSGAAQTVAYDAAGRPTTVSDGGVAHGLAHDARGRVISTSTIAGTSVGFEYDELGQPTRILRPDGSVAQASAYDAVGNLVRSTGPLGGVTEHSYDAADRLVATTQPDGAIERHEYDAAGQRTATVDALGNRTRYEYDAAGRLVRTIDPLGGVATIDYDVVGNVVAETDPLGRTTTYVHDAADRLVRTIYADGASEERRYDAAGQLVTIIDPAGFARTLGYDAGGRLASVTDELGGTTTIQTDEAARMRTVVDANGNATVTTFDAQGRPLVTRRPGGQQESVTYDAVGRVTARTDANGETVRIEYGASSRPERIVLPDGGEEVFAYTADGLIASVSEPRGTTTLEYDPLTRRLLRVTEPDGRYVRYEHDALGRRTVVATGSPGGPESVVRHAHDALGRLVEVTDADGGVTTYDLDAVGQQIAIRRPNGTVTEQTFDARGRVTSIVHRDPVGGVLESFVYVLDARGNRLSEQSADGARVEYEYDAAGRVVAERRRAPDGTPSGAITYAYDAVGNLVARGGDLGAATFSYDVNDQLLAGGGVTYTHDAAGNRTSATAAGAVTEYAWDARGRLVGVLPSSGAATEYRYDFEGVRVASDGPAGAVDFLVDRADPGGLSQVLRESAPDGTVLRTYLHGTDLLAEQGATGWSWRHPDALGSTRLLSDASGSPTDLLEYSAYGVTLAHAGGTTSRYRFAGEERDPESGLYHLRARYYDPASGRFLSRDPSPGDPTRPLSLHDYAYAHANPVNLVDPSGRSVPTSLVEVLGVIRTQLELRKTEVLNFISTQEKVVETTGDVVQRVGAALGFVALAEEVDNPRIVRMFFGKLIPGVSAGSLVPGGLVTGFASISYQAIASLRLLQTVGKMLAENMEYKIENLAACKPGYYAVAVQGAGIRHVELCPGYFTLRPLPSSSKLVFGGASDASMAGVMVHEWTHLTFRAKDDYYLCSRARTIGAASAVDNADSYRCWVEYSAVGISDEMVEKLFIY